MLHYNLLWFLWCYLVCNFFAYILLFTFYWAERGGIGPWPGWLTIILQCYDTVGWVIWAVKSSDFPSPFFPNLCILSGQAKTFHSLYDAIRWNFPWMSPLSGCIFTCSMSKPSQSTLQSPRWLDLIVTVVLPLHFYSSLSHKLTPVSVHNSKCIYMKWQYKH